MSFSFRNQEQRDHGPSKLIPPPRVPAKAGPRHPSMSLPSPSLLSRCLTPAVPGGSLHGSDPPNHLLFPCVRDSFPPHNYYTKARFRSRLPPWSSHFSKLPCRPHATCMWSNKLKRARQGSRVNHFVFFHRSHPRRAPEGKEGWKKLPSAVFSPNRCRVLAGITCYLRGRNESTFSPRTQREDEVILKALLLWPLLCSAAVSSKQWTKASSIIEGERAAAAHIKRVEVCSSHHMAVNINSQQSFPTKSSY